MTQLAFHMLFTPLSRKKRRVVRPFLLLLAVLPLRVPASPLIPPLKGVVARLCCGTASGKALRRGGATCRAWRERTVGR